MIGWKLALRRLRRFVMRHHAVAPAILEAQIREVMGQIELVAPVNVAAALLVAWLYRDSAPEPALLIGCCGLIICTAVSLVALPRAKLERIRYKSLKSERRALHIFSVATGLGWSAIIAVPIMNAGEGDRFFLLCAFVAAMSAGGLTLAMLPVGATLYVSVLAVSIAFSLAHLPTEVPPAFYCADIVYSLLLARAFFTLANLFVGQLQSAGELTAAERRRAEEEHAEFERRTAQRLMLEQEREQERAEQEARHRATRLALADRFEADVIGIVQLLGQAVETLQDSTATLGRIGADTRGKAAAMAERATSATEAVAGVAAASDQMLRAVAEISGQVREQVEASDSARRSALQTRATLAELATSAGSIASIATFIQDIATRTNLLALNATIEAARAGDAGRGFAVVAHEVKSLANQTGAAIERIGATVEAIQGRVEDALAAMDRAAADVEVVTRGAGAIAAAVEQQRSSSAHIGSNAASAAEDAADVHAQIGSVADGAHQTSNLTDSMRGIAATLDTQSQALGEAARAFLSHLRAA